ncbi:MAG: AAA family ATPase [Solirubrobacterales bacterium]
MLGARGTRTLLEREKELAALDSALERAGGGSGSLTVVRGPAGIGKSELLAAAASRARAQGMEVLSARGGEFERSLGFGVARQLFEGRLATAGEEERGELLDGAASLALPALMVSGIEERTPSASSSMGDPAAPIQHGLYWLVANLAERAPLLIAIDDLQWADAESARWLLYLTRRIADLPVAAVVAVRSGEPGLDPGLLAALEREPDSRTVEPEALSEEAGVELVRTELAADAEQDFCAACHRAASGNPFLLHELIEAARAEEIPPTADSANRIVAISPETVSRSVMIRLGRLPASAVALTQAVAILGDGTQPSWAARMADLDADEMAAAAAQLEEAAILARGDTLAFVHPLIRAAVYADMPAAQRAQAHSRAAELLPVLGATPEVVAGQLLQAEPGGVPDALNTLRRAAAEASARLAPEAAVAYLRRAFQEPAAAEVRHALLAELLVAAAVATDLSAFDGISDDPAAEILEDDEAFDAAGADLVAWLFLNGRIEELPDVIQRGIDNYRERGEDALALRYEALALSVIDIKPPEAVTRLERYAERLRPGTDEQRAWFAMRGWWQHLQGGTAAESTDLVRRGIDHGELLEIHDLGPAFGQAVLVLLRADELDEAEGWIDRMVADARMRSPAYMASALGLRSWLAQRRGDLRSAELDARRTVDICREHRIVLALAINLRWLMDVLYETGELEEAEQELASSGLDGPLPEFWWFSPLRLARARVRIALGRAGEVIDELRELLRHTELTRPASDPTASTLALALHSQGIEPDEVARLLDWELSAAREWGTPRGIGVALRAKGMVENGEAGMRLLAESVETLRGSPARLELAHSLTQLGSALRRANRRVEAREPLKEALEIAHRSGATPLAERAREELAASGAKPRREMLSGVESLTPSELRVARMAADGMGNREIAQDLFVSVKTVETHLGSVYRKLDISSRTELPAALSG